MYIVLIKFPFVDTDTGNKMAEGENLLNRVGVNYMSQHTRGWGTIGQVFKNIGLII